MCATATKNLLSTPVGYDVQVANVVPRLNKMVVYHDESRVVHFTVLRTAVRPNGHHVALLHLIGVSCQIRDPLFWTNGGGSLDDGTLSLLKRVT